MDPIAILVIAGVIAAVILATRGSKGPQPSPAPATRDELLFAYYGCFDGQISATKDHVNCLHVWDICDYGSADGRAWMQDKQIGWMREAQANGISKVILGIGYLVLSAKPPYRFRGVEDFSAFKQRLGPLADMVVALYFVDEPDLYGCDDADMRTGIAMVKAIWPLPVATIYGDHGTPGLAAVDWAGVDKYGVGAAVLGQQPAAPRGIIVPGGADPWKQDPAPFVDYALAHPQVKWLCPFLWGNYEGRAGIFTNEMVEAYRRAGRAVLAANLPKSTL